MRLTRHDPLLALDEADLDEVPPVLWHRAARCHRASIARHGLLPARPTVDGNYRRCAVHNPRAVYGMAYPTSEWGKGPGGAYGCPTDLWAFDVRGLPLIADCYISEAYAVPLRIPPGRLLRVDGRAAAGYLSQASIVRPYTALFERVMEWFA